MEDASDAAAAWVERTLAEARAAVREHPLGPRDQSWEQFEASTRAMAAAFLRSTDGYLGLTRVEAEQRAGLEQDHLCVHNGPTGHRMYSSPNRVHVKLGADGRICKAGRDTAPWCSPDEWQKLQAELS